MGFAEAEALLPPKQVVASQTVAVAMDGGEREVHDWDGSCVDICGPRCDAVGASSCALSYFLPCVAFGINAKRALMASAWLHGLLYVTFFMLGRTLYNAAMWNVYLQCGVEDAAHLADSHRKLLTNKPAMHDQTPECQSSIVALLAADVLMVVFVIVGVVYAARRRTLLRRKLGIAGCWVKDLALWCCCAPCALCQETRTLAIYNVEGGVWHGPTRFVVPMAAPTPTAASKM